MTAFALVLPALLAPLAVLGASLSEGPALLPVLASAAVYPIMVRLILKGRPIAASAAVLLWAASLSGSIIGLTSHDPLRAGALIIHGPAYRDEMFEFVRTGAGREGEPARFLPQHALHLAAFAALAALSGGLLAIVAGSVMVGYMSYYVGALVAAGGAPGRALFLGWPPYALLRVAGFVVLGVALSRPGLALAARRPIAFEARRRFYATALVLLVADALLKALVAPVWAALLRPCLLRP